MKFGKNFHKVQGVSLLIAVILIWLPFINHMTALGIATLIVLINAIIEFLN